MIANDIFWINISSRERGTGRYYEDRFISHIVNLSHSCILSRSFMAVVFLPDMNEHIVVYFRHFGPNTNPR